MLLIYVGGRHLVVLLALAIAVLAVAAIAPEPTLLSAQAAILGLASRWRTLLDRGVVRRRRLRGVSAGRFGGGTGFRAGRSTSLRQFLAHRNALPRRRLRRASSHERYIRWGGHSCLPKWRIFPGRQNVYPTVLSSAGSCVAAGPLPRAGGCRHRDRRWSHRISPRAGAGQPHERLAAGRWSLSANGRGGVPTAGRGGQLASIEGPEGAPPAVSPPPIRGQVGRPAAGRHGGPGRDFRRIGAGRLAAGAVRSGHCSTSALGCAGPCTAEGGCATTSGCATRLGHGRRQRAASGGRSARAGSASSGRSRPAVIWTAPRAFRSSCRSAAAGELLLELPERFAPTIDRGIFWAANPPGAG